MGRGGTKASKARSNKYSYDAVYEAGNSQESVFADVEPIVTSVMDGYNVCIFAYGQTGMCKHLKVTTLVSQKLSSMSCKVVRLVSQKLSSMSCKVLRLVIQKLSSMSCKGVRLVSQKWSSMSCKVVRLISQKLSSMDCNLN